MTLIVGVVCKDGIVLVGDRLVTDRHGTVLHTATKVVDLPNGAALGVAGYRWDCMHVLDFAKQRPVVKETAEHVLDILREVRAMDHSETWGTPPPPVDAIPSVKALLAVPGPEGPKLLLSRRCEPFEPVAHVEVIGDEEDAARSAITSLCTPDCSMLGAVVQSWRVIRHIETTFPNPSIGLHGELPDVRMFPLQGPPRTLSAGEAAAISEAVERARRGED